MVLHRQLQQLIPCVGGRSAVRFETPGGDLERTGRFLRVRTGFASVVTFKQKLGKDTKFKVRKEIELAVEDPKKMEQLIEGLGFTKRWIMEKYREKWQVLGVEVVIDKLPFGTYMEIEGSRTSIKNVVAKLGLNMADGLIDGYNELWIKSGGTGNIIFAK